MDELKHALLSAKNLKQLSEVFNKFKDGGFATLEENILLSLFPSGSTFVLDSFNQVSVAKIKSMHEADYGREIKLSAGFSTVSAVAKRFEVSWSPMRFPDHTCLCGVCGKGWDLSNVTDPVKTDDVIIDDDAAVYGSKYFRASREDRLIKLSFTHGECAATQYDADFSKAIVNLFKAAGVKINFMEAVDNKYNGTNLYGHWYKLETDVGTMTVGWRKRVIQLKIDGTWFDLRKIITTTNTIDTDLVHAYSYDELGEFLKLFKTAYDNLGKVDELQSS